MSPTRRRFTLTAAASLVALPGRSRAKARAKVVVIGGGAGGATAARHIAKEAQGALDVTLIAAAPRFTTCFFSNLYLGGLRSLESLTHGYERLASAYGITVVTAMARSIEREGRTVGLADGSTLPYDRLVVSLGIDFVWDSVPGYSEAAAEVMPHAWTAGPQTRLLKARLDEVRDGETIVIVAPPNPYRCPPGPYERASMMAHALKSKGLKGTKIIILDPKETFSKQALFEEGWARHYPGMIEWYGPDVHGGIRGVDPAAGTVATDFDIFKGALVNVIPAQKAGAIAAAAGLADDSGFCPVDPHTMRSRKDADVFVIGDSARAGDMPKSAFSANSQAKVAAMAVRADLLGGKLPPARYANACWSLIAPNDGIKVGGEYVAGDAGIAATSTFVSEAEEDGALRKATFEESLAWYAAITADMFG
jgi:NADPH-dependent 2,4-dienoyl-CoA reductase/sulfur reductase-like enzyme